MQRMRYKTKWVTGLTYDMGVARQLGKRFFAEIRLNGTFNPDIPYRAPQTIPVRTMQLLAHLHLGYWIW